MHRRALFFLFSDRFISGEDPADNHSKEKRSLKPREADHDVRKHANLSADWIVSLVCSAPGALRVTWAACTAAKAAPRDHGCSAATRALFGAKGQTGIIQNYPSLSGNSL
jgi:hypothetical protein